MSNPTADTIPAKRPKTGGRKPGSKNKVTREIRELAGKYTLRAVREAWRIASQSGEDNTRLRALELLLGYGHGKPTQRQELTGADGGGVEVSRIERIIVDPDWGPPPEKEEGVGRETEAGPDIHAISTSSESKIFGKSEKI